MDTTAPEPVARWARHSFRVGCLATVAVGFATHARAADLASSSGAFSAPTSALALVAILGGLGVAVTTWRRSHHGASHAAAFPPRTAQRTLSLSQARPSTPTPKPVAMPTRSWGRVPDLDPIAYDGEMSKFVARQPAPEAVAPKTAPAKGSPSKTQSLSDATRQRILERYIGARFTGVASRGEDFLDTPRIVKSARLFFEDGQIERAVELLQLATEVNPANEAAWLAMLEILFLGTDAPGYARAARRFALSHAASPSWPQIRQLGRKLGLDDAVICNGMAHQERFPNYGPWLGLPNWIQAPWDLTGDAALAELHARLRNEAELAADAANKRRAA